eukprot:m.377067 g.377067  ORF g.377067 m.377067 type:complete len:302 (-) comp20923_c0_seq75:2425-3330(-)
MSVTHIHTTNLDFMFSMWYFITYSVHDSSSCRCDTRQWPVPLIPKQIADFISRVDVTSASGVDGHTAFDIKNMSIQVLYTWFSLIASNKLPKELQQIYAGGKLTALEKPSTAQDGRFRPIIPQSLCYRNTAGILTKQYYTEHKQAAGIYQLGINRRSGAEQALFSTQTHMEQHPNHFILALDIANGYNSILRQPVREYLQQNAPHLVGIFDTAYGTNPRVQMTVDKTQIHIYLKDGVIQGDPLAGLYFTLPLAEIQNFDNNSTNSSTSYTQKSPSGPPTLQTSNHRGFLLLDSPSYNRRLV